jgi:hypothetical protein
MVALEKKAIRDENVARSSSIPLAHSLSICPGPNEA